MNPAQAADAVQRYLLSRLEPAVDQYGEELAGEIRESVNVPVGYAGGRVIRSKPGEPPRREFGTYMASITHAGARIEGDSVRTEVGSPTKLGVWLEGGTETIQPRPHFGPAVRRARAGQAVRSIQQNL